MTVIYNMSIDRADKPWIGDRRFTEQYRSLALHAEAPLDHNFRYPRIRELTLDNDAIALGGPPPHLLTPPMTECSRYLIALSCPKAGTHCTLRIGTPNSPKTAK